MKEFKVISFTDNKTFNPTIGNHNNTFKVSLTKTGGSVNTTNFNDSKTIKAEANINSSSNQMNPNMDVSGGTIDEYYDEVIYYDGGGVEGYGY